MIQDWPQDIGGKPVLVILKTCQLCSNYVWNDCFFAAFNGYYFYSKYYFKQAENPDGTTDDHFLMEVAVNNNEEELVSFSKYRSCRS
jgi:hypothetical protein